MTVTKETVETVESIKKQDETLRSYISYFQSVTTIGIINLAHNIQEAEDKAEDKFYNSDLSCGIVAQTPFERSDTEIWSPDFTGCYMESDNNYGKMSFNMNGETKQRIARRLSKTVDEVTEDDYVEFVKNALEHSLI